MIASNGNLSNGHGRHSNGNGTLNGVVTRGPGGLHEDLEFPSSTRTLSRRKSMTWMRPHVRKKISFQHIE